MKRIAFIPIDNRPVCYTLPMQIAATNPDIDLILPERKLLGDLTQPANIIAIIHWLETLKDIDAIVLSLDTIAYGGLIPSRRSDETLEKIKDRINLLKRIIKEKNCKTYAFSSIMRISNNNFNEEEKEYWSSYGERIFEYSYNTHKMEETLDSELNNKCFCISSKIPPEILDDYLITRSRNFKINQYYLDLLTDNTFTTLIYAKDDCAQYGFNVKEANQLSVKIKEKHLPALVKTGADEIPLTLLSRAILDGRDLRIAPVFSQPIGIGKISKYEDISVLESIKSQIETAGAIYSNPQNADLILYVNNFKNEQGELVMNIHEPSSRANFTPYSRPYFVADILNANGADFEFVENMLNKGININNFCGFAAWNTTGNTLGSAICAAITKFTAPKPNIENFKKQQLVRFLDDWAYQGKIRQKMKSKYSEPDIEYVKRKMKKYEDRLYSIFRLAPTKLDYKFPWERSFEIEIELK